MNVQMLLSHSTGQDIFGSENGNLCTVILNSPIALRTPRCAIWYGMKNRMCTVTLSTTPRFGCVDRNLSRENRGSLMDQFSRTELLLGEEALGKLKNATVAVFGVGGVGGYVVEALARCGVGSFVLIDNDVVSMTNINRQIIATLDTVGRSKVQIMKERILSINREAKVQIHECFFLPENADEFDFSHYSYVVDAVDTVTAKLTIIEKATKAQVPVISSMGTGNKLDPTGFEITDISKTSVCPLAKVMRRELKKRGISKCKVLYSKEEPVRPAAEQIQNMMNEEKTNSARRCIPGSVSFVPSVAGLIIGGEVVKDLCR